jgi:hypothetical protein
MCRPVKPNLDEKDLVSGKSNAFIVHIVVDLIVNSYVAKTKQTAGRDAKSNSHSQN